MPAFSYQPMTMIGKRPAIPGRCYYWYTRTEYIPTWGYEENCNPTWTSNPGLRENSLPFFSFFETKVDERRQTAWASPGHVMGDCSKLTTDARNTARADVVARYSMEKNKTIDNRIDCIECTAVCMWYYPPSVILTYLDENASV